jgi:outer membrane immunogenic protein
MSDFPTNFYPFQTDTFRSVAKSSGHDIGAALDLFAGVNQQIGRHLVGGVQVEGSIADLSFDSDGTRSFVESNDAGPTGYTGEGPFRPHVYSRWMVSALARAGLLVSPTTLAYGLVGWTGAQFEYQNLTDNLFYQPEDSFWANGITFGGGAEQKLASNWNICAEYRYTDFPDLSVGNNFSWSSSLPSTQTNTIRTKFDENMQMVRVGVSYLLR